MSLTVALTAAALVASSTVVGGAPAGGANPGPEEAASRYIVVLHDDVGSAQEVADEQATTMGVEVSGVYSHALKGYTADLTPDEVARVRADERVAYVEPDQVLRLMAQEPPTGIRRAFADQNPLADIDGQDDARVDVDVAVIDSGVHAHPDLDVESRADCTKSRTCTVGQGEDDNGHGTHVAGTIGAIDDEQGVVGVAPGARIHSLKVCDASGQCTLSAMVAGIDHVTARADVIEVANMSLGGRGESRALEEAISKSVDAGVVYVVAAGNDTQDAAEYVPASYDDVIAVSALADSDGKPGADGGPPSCRQEDQDDHLAGFSNYGDVVDIAAPGVCIQSTWNDGGLKAISGTSMASPHVAGAAALLASGNEDPTGRLDVMLIKLELVLKGNREYVDSSGDDIQEPLLDASELD
jgi:subtilisin family serine protease